MNSKLYSAYKRMTKCIHYCKFGMSREFNQIGRRKFHGMIQSIFINMKWLSQYQIRQEELRLLQSEGTTLQRMSNDANTLRVYRQVENMTHIGELQRIKPERAQNLGISSNANLRGFALCLLNSMFSNPVKDDLIGLVKSRLYCPQLDISSLKHSPLPNLSNNQMKKLSVEFFLTLAYSSQQSKIQSQLRKNPMVLDVLVLFLRALLVQNGFKNADDCLFKLPTRQLFSELVEYFDINCKLMNSIFLFYQDRLFAFENTNSEILVGKYMENEVQKNSIENLKKTLKLSQLQQQFQEDTENERSQRPSLSNHNRSLQFRGIVSQSIVFQPQSSTPFFNLDPDHDSSFQSSQDSGKQIISRKQSLMKGSKQMSLLKMMDSRCLGTQGGLGNVMRSTIIENQLKQSIQSKQPLGLAIMQSPIALESPHTLYSDGNFPCVNADFQITQNTKNLKKSKSQNGSRMSQKLLVNEQQCHQQPESQCDDKTMLKKAQKCFCFKKKKNSIKLCSNLYEINMRYVYPSSNIAKLKQKASLDLSQGETYISSRGKKKQIQLTKNRQNTSFQCLRNNNFQQKPQKLDYSMNSCYILPRILKDLDSLSRKDVSPKSNNGQRSTSPMNLSPKITFTYGNEGKNVRLSGIFAKKTHHG